MSLKYHPQNSHLAVGLFTGIIMIFNLANGNKISLQSEICDLTHQEPVNDLEWIKEYRSKTYTVTMCINLDHFVDFSLFYRFFSIEPELSVLKMEAYNSDLVQDWNHFKLAQNSDLCLEFWYLSLCSFLPDMKSEFCNRYGKNHGCQ